MWKKLVWTVSALVPVTLLAGCNSTDSSLESKIPEQDYKTLVSVFALIEYFGEDAFHGDGIDMDGNWFSSTADIISLKVIDPKEFEGKILSVYRHHPNPFPEQWKNEGTYVSFDIPLVFLKSPYEWPEGGSTETYTDVNGDIESVEFKHTHIKSVDTTAVSAPR